MLTPFPGRLNVLRRRGHRLTRYAEVLHRLVRAHNITVLEKARPRLPMIPEPTTTRSFALSHPGSCNEHLTLVFCILIPILILLNYSLQQECLVE